MNTTKETLQHQMSRALRAVLHIFNADAELRNRALPWVNVERESIEWSEIWRNSCFGGGHSAAVIWAQALWCDCIETKSDPFERAFAMDAPLQIACIEALAIRWGLKK